MALPSLSQNISIEKNRVKTIILNGDTLVQMHYEDARVLLEDVLHYEYADSLLAVYKGRDSLNTKTVTLQKEAITKLSFLVFNLSITSFCIVITLVLRLSLSL